MLLNHWEVGGRPQCCGCRVRIAHSIVSRLWKQFQTTGTATRGFSSGRLRGTTPTDDRHIDTRHRRLDDRYRVLPWPEDCTVVVCLHDALYGVYLKHLPIGEGVLCGAGNTGIEETMNGDEYSFESRFSLRF
ncbi:hypothetical protein TNCV_4797561 [Trichonephila clavipes]|nr:hypothetical protein TNCV_4797561 [Trichonephila clavipes]